jgi:hypothetical protein
MSVLGPREVKEVKQHLEALCDAETNPTRCGRLGLVIRKGRLVGLRTVFRVPDLDQDGLKTLDALVQNVAQETGFGEAELLVEGGEIVGAKVEFSLSV